MAQAILFINGEMIRQRGIAVPKRVTDFKHWVRVCQRAFDADLRDHGISLSQFGLESSVYKHAVEPEDIRFSCKVMNTDIGVLIRREADSLAR